jgi:hypothetical protein
MLPTYYDRVVKYMGGITVIPAWLKSLCKYGYDKIGGWRGLFWASLGFLFASVIMEFGKALAMTV